MQVNKLRIDGEFFFLEPSEDLTALKAQIVAAARDGADFVAFEALGRGRVSVLITQAIPVRFEELDRTEDEVAELAQHESISFDLDTAQFLD